MPALANLSDAQTKEVLAVFDILDTDRDGMIDMPTARLVCERFGFHPEPPADGVSTPVSREAILSWLDVFTGQAQAQTSHAAELRNSQRYALLRTFDLFGGGSQHKVSRKALAGFLAEEGHKVKPQLITYLLEDYGDGLTITRPQLKSLMKDQALAQQRAASAAAVAAAAGR